LLSFEKDIKPLFREKDRLDMEYVFDLWKYEDVKEEAENISNRLNDQTMPCDAPWPTEQIQKIREWIDGGCQP
jgi:hypothetical protein